MLFGAQTADGLVEAIRRFETERFDPDALHRVAEPFDAARFDREFDAAFSDGLAARRAGGRADAIAAVG